MNCFDNTLDVAKNICVPETQDAIAIVSEATITNFIIAGFGMLPAVNLDDQRVFTAYKITNITTDWFLPHKLAVSDLSVT